MSSASHEDSDMRKTKSWYLINGVSPPAAEPNVTKAYEVLKTDPDMRQLERYVIRRYTNQPMMCTCYAGAQVCRHQKMLLLFEKHTPTRVGCGIPYDFDNQRWQE